MTSTEFENHPIHQILVDLIERLSQEETAIKIDIDKLNFYNSTVKYINDRIKLTIPIIVPTVDLNAIFTDLQNGLAQINLYMGNNNVGHLTTADTHFNASLTKVRNLPLPFSKNDFNFAKSISNFESIVKAKLEEVEKENLILKDELKKTQRDLSAKQTEIDQISRLLTDKTTEIKNLASTFQTNYENIKSTAEQKFENSQKTFRTEITADRETFKKDVEKDRTDFRKEIDLVIDDINTYITECTNEINTKLGEAKKLVNVIGNVGVTGNYQKIANENKKTANFWRWTAIVFMLGMSGLLIWAIWDVSSADYDWIKSMIRIIAAAALSYPATYAARESSKHRKLEHVNRRLELELASLTPFIEMLPEDKKTDIKSKLVEKYFGNHFEISDDKTNNEEELSLSGFERIMKMILQITKK